VQYRCTIVAVRLHYRQEACACSGSGLDGHLVVPTLFNSRAATDCNLVVHSAFVRSIAQPPCSILLSIGQSADNPASQSAGESLV